jgi:hypothetical protein
MRELFLKNVPSVVEETSTSRRLAGLFPNNNRNCNNRVFIVTVIEKERKISGNFWCHRNTVPNASFLLDIYGERAII